MSAITAQPNNIGIVTKPAMRFAKQHINSYLRLHSVPGWLHPLSAQVIAAVSLHQVESGYHGSLAEIGVHRGKLFFVLYLTSAADEVCVAIDPFSPQVKKAFLKQAQKWGASALRLINDYSRNVTPEHLSDICGRVRLFSVDGSHTESDTLVDLRLARAVLTEEGIIVLDDCFNQYWPDVSSALSKFLQEQISIVPFAVTPNKVFLCNRGMKTHYTRFFESTFRSRLDRAAVVFGHEATVFGLYPSKLRQFLAHSSVGVALKWVMRGL